MTVLRYCRACFGPRPRAARRCPWCHASYDAPLEKPGRPMVVTGSTAPPQTQEQANE